MTDQAEELAASDRYARYDAELESLLAELSHKQRLFCREYFIHFNATQAAVIAGYSKASARQIGSENLSKPAIMAAVDCFMGLQDSETEITASLIEREYWKLYRLTLANGKEHVARQCLHDLGEHHAMFIKVVASAEAGELAMRLASGRSRMNEARALRDAGGLPGPEPVNGNTDELPAL
jgi:phage terminase small subunit